MFNFFKFSENLRNCTFVYLPWHFTPCCFWTGSINPLHCPPLGYLKGKRTGKINEVKNKKSHRAQSIFCHGKKSVSCVYVLCSPPLLEDLITGIDICLFASLTGWLSKEFYAICRTCNIVLWATGCNWPWVTQ